MKFTSLDVWYLASRDWTGIDVLCPTAGATDEVTKTLLGEHEIDGVVYEVVAVETPSTAHLFTGSLVALMVEGKEPMLKWLRAVENNNQLKLF